MISMKRISTYVSDIIFGRFEVLKMSLVCRVRMGIQGNSPGRACCGQEEAGRSGAISAVCERKCIKWMKMAR